ncbi:MAG: hypothetical protein K8T91_00415 [Planctomycetes bacterium]|nr:hypothetical protein [Planctomycetota bacterium]
MMSLVDAIALVKTTPASKLTAAELIGLREVVEHNPAMASLVGGPQVLEQYLAAAEEAVSATRAATRPGNVQGEAATLPPPMRTGSGGRQTAVLAVAVLFVMVAGIYFWWPREVTQPVSDARPAEMASKPPVKVEPVVEKTPAPLPPQLKAKQPEVTRSEPEKSKSDALPSWQGWQVKLFQGARMAEHTRWDLSDPLKARPQSLLVVTGGGGELFSDQQQIDGRHWLRMALAEGSEGHGGQIEVRADGQAIARFPLQKAGIYVVPLEFLRGKRVRLSIAHLPGKTPETIVWDTISLVADKSGVAWTVLKPTRVEAAGGAKLQVQPDHCVVAAGTNVAADQYMVTATIPNFNVRAIRLEALRDASLPASGPGRGSRGEYCISKFSASLTEADERRAQLIGRYVRVEVPLGPLTTSEVEVYSGGKNVALGKPTAQSSVDGLAFCELAVDGVTQGVLTREQTSVMRTQAGVPEGWWEVDLGREYPLERIVLWSGPEHLHNELDNHRVVVLDMHRNVVWHHFHPDHPTPALTYGPFVTSHSPLEMQTAILRTMGGRDEAPWLVRTGTGTTGSGLRLSEPCDFIFSLGRSGEVSGRLSLANRQVTFRIQHQDAPPPVGAPSPAGQVKAAEPDKHDNLGRFRISVTEDPVPLSPEPPSELVPLLPGVGSSPTKSPSEAGPKVDAQPAAVAAPVAGDPPAKHPPAAQRVPNALPKDYTWEGWTVTAEPGIAPKYPWDITHTEAPRIEPRFTMEGKSATLSQTRVVEAKDAWLRVRAGQTTATAPLGNIEVRVDGRAIARFEALWVDEAPDRLVSLADFVGRRIKLELVYLPGSKDEVVEFLTPSFVANPQEAGFAEWQTLAPIALGSRWKSTLSALPDHSILSGGENSPGDVYSVTVRMPSARTPQEKITAVRLEVLPHPALPMLGPGRGDRGRFNVGKFSAELVDPNRQPQTHTGRYVRVELPGHQRSLQMSELQVFSGGKNVSLGKPARQPSVMFNGTADRGVDGIVGPSYDGKGGVAFAHTANDTPEVWWEVDLQQDFPIERIVIWNRQAGGEGLANHRILILDKDRKPMWDQTNLEFPVPCTAYEFPYAPRPIRFAAADVSFDVKMRAGQPPLPDPIVIAEPPRDKPLRGWEVSNVPGRMQVATFTFAPDQNLAGQLVRFELGDFVTLHSAVGRFRLSVTTTAEPQKALRPVVIVERI